MSRPALTAFCAICALIGQATSSAAAGAGSQTPNSVTDATAFAITYAYPLIQYASSFDSVLSSTGANSIFNEANIATANEAAINRPNVDTIYSKIPIDLSHVNIALTIPKVPGDRFYVFPFYDFWANNYVNLGNIQSTAPGKYLLQLAKDEGSVGFKSCKNRDSKYKGIVNVPTVYGMILPRILLRNQTGDVDAVNKIQAQIKIEEIPRSECSVAPKLTTELLSGSSLASMVLQSAGDLSKEQVHKLLTVTARLAPYNMPISVSEASKVKHMFAVAGLSKGEYVAPDGVNHDMASKAINATLVTDSSLLEEFQNGWVDFIASASGNFHQHYAIRAYICQTAYLDMMQSEALYPEWIGGGITGLFLKPDESYIFTFPSGKPNVLGFWSLTAYNSTNYLIENSLNRYALGDRSNLTYPDGKLVYGNAKRNDPFSILIQPADVEPNGNWSSNWLPAPAGGGNFSVNLRAYGPGESMYSGGSYVYPVVTKQGAIKA